MVIEQEGNESAKIGGGKVSVWRERRGVWSPLMLGLITALILLSVLIFIWIKSNNSGLSWIHGLLDLAHKTPP